MTQGIIYAAVMVDGRYAKKCVNVALKLLIDAKLKICLYIKEKIEKI